MCVPASHDPNITLSVWLHLFCMKQSQKGLGREFITSKWQYDKNAFMHTCIFDVWVLSCLNSYLASCLIYCTHPLGKAWACLDEIKSLCAWLLCDQPLTSHRFLSWSFARHTWILVRVLHLGNVVIAQIIAQWSGDWLLYVVYVVSNASYWSTKAKTSWLANSWRPLNIASLHYYCKMINMPHQN